MIPEHIELLRRALPFLKQTWVVDEIVALLAEGPEHVVPDTMPTAPFFDDLAVRFCHWISFNHRFPSGMVSEYIWQYARALGKELEKKDETPPPIRPAEKRPHPH